MPVNPIGIIRTPFLSLENMPIQPGGASEVHGTIELQHEFTAGLQDLEGFSHIYLIYFFHQATRTELVVTPFMDTVPHGVFATRSPLRPNHIGMSLVKLLSIHGSTLRIEGVDMLNNTPLLDIKPFISSFDQITGSRNGWMTATTKDVAEKRSDKRFI